MSNLRIGGLASGIDTQSIIEQMMRVERMPLDRMMQRKQTLEWQRDDYRAINLKLQEFRNFLSDSFGRQATLNAKKVVSSNSDRVTATARADAGNASFTISKVTQLAAAASNYSTDKISGNGEKLNPNGKLWSHFKDSLFDNAESVEKRDMITVNSAAAKEFSLTKAGIDQVTSIKVNDEEYSAVGTWTTDENGDRTLTLQADSGKTVVVKDDGSLTFSDFIFKDSKIEANYSFKQGSFDITTYDKEGSPVKKTFTYDGSMTLNQLINTVNRENAGVSMFYDEQTDKVSVVRTESGKFNAGGKEIEFDGHFLTDILNLDTNSVNAIDGKNAIFVVNGLETSRSTNEFTISGTTITLRDTFDDNQAVSINVSADVDKVVDSVKEFITKYNEMIDLINGKLTEERYRSFKPLTDEQKMAMSDKEIEIWEEKARSGLFRNDPVLSSGLSQIRMALMQQVEGLTSSLGIKHLSEIGIVTSKNYMDGGKLELDNDLQGADRLNGEARLRKAIAEDPEGFYQMFMGGTSDGPQAEQGIARRVIGLIDKTIKENIEQRAGNEFRKNHQFTLGRELDDVNKRISNFERRLQQLEDRYWKQFSAMESALAKLNSQSESLMSFMTSFSGNNR